jgi:Fe-S oxidoreductase
MSTPVNRDQIKRMLKARKSRMKRYLSHCMHCGVCAESCFLYMKNDKDPQYLPSYKVLNSLGKLYKKGGRVDRAFLLKIKPIVWKNCVLCRRCYCPVGVDVPAMIAFARSICRSQGVYPEETQSWL